MRKRCFGLLLASARSNPMSLIGKYFDSLGEVEKTVSDFSFVPKSLAKIVISLKVLTDLVGVLLILAIIVSVIGLVVRIIL